MSSFMYIYQNTVLPHYTTIPVDFTRGLAIVELPLLYTQLIYNSEISRYEIKLLSTSIELDVYISYIATSISIEELCDLVLLFSNDIKISKYVILDILKKHITVTGLETHMWIRNMGIMEYSHYKFANRNWPYSNKKTEEVRKIGVDLGIIRHNYPCGNIEMNENVYGTREENDAKYQEWLVNAKSISNIGVYTIPDFKTLNEEYTTRIIEKICSIFMLFERDDLIILCICTLMTTRKYYHTVMHSVFILNLLNSLMKKHVLLYKIIKYTLSYSIYMMVKEECLLGKDIKNDSRCILTGDVLRALPIFTENEPYMVDIDTSSKNIILHLHKARKRRITTKKEFKDRLSLIMGGMLDGIDLKKYDAALTGSIIVPCVAVSPLEDNYKEGDFLSFANDYYPPLSTIEPLWSRYEELEKKRRYYMDTLPQVEYMEEEEKHLQFLKCMPVTHRNMDEEIYISYYNAEKKTADADIGIHAPTMMEYTRKVFSIYKEIENNLRIRLKRHPEIRLCKQPLVYGYKWILRGKDTIRSIDFFKINISMPSLMTRFHYPIVKFWWDGIELRGLISGACAAITGVNLFYKHFNNGKDPIQIALKYLKRGYTTLLNNNEIDALERYVSIIPMYRYLSNNVLVGRISSRHILFSNGLHMQHDNTIYPHTRTIFRSQRLGTKFVFSDNVYVSRPKTHALEAIINDLMDA
jgi:hypothetical protein